MSARSRLRSAKGALEADSVCFQCLAEAFGVRATRQYQRSFLHTKRNIHAVNATERVANPQTFFEKYFSTNLTIGGRNLRKLQRPSSIGSAVKSSTFVSSQQPSSTEALETNISSESNIGSEIAEKQKPVVRRRSPRWDSTPTEEPVIPPDASSQLTTAATNLPSSASFRRKLATYLSLTKPRLSFLMTLTATTSYSLYPVPDILSSSAIDLSTTTLTLVWLTTGTFLSSACANTLNMAFEPKYDAQMSRTKNRPLVRKLITQRASYIFAFVTGASGVALLFFGTNPTVAALSALNIFLYAGVYTPMKRLSVINTWVGAVVGAIPPMMGWIAASAQTATLEHHSWKDLLFSEDSMGGWLLAALLYAWQFPHFNALSHTIRDEYRNAGYRMLAWVNPAMNARVGLRYSILLFPICAGLWYTGVVNPAFLVVSGACNIWMTREAYKFWKRAGTGGSARGLFWASIWHLPLVMVGGLICKAGVWEGFWKTDEEEDEEDEFVAVPVLKTSQSSNRIDDKAQSEQTSV